LSDIVERLRDKTYVTPVERVRLGEIAAGEIVRLREYHQDALKQLATTRDERDRLRDALDYYDCDCPGTECHRYDYCGRPARAALKGDTP